ncbi:MAG TPA: hypothetical protein VGM90_32430 [Kofleriaceae bacterium]|jgi:hypothetical protein
MKRIALAACLLVACGGKGPAPKAPKDQNAKEQIAFAIHLKKSMCACKDGGCATAITQDLLTWTDERVKQSADVEEELRPYVLGAQACSDSWAGPDAQIIRLDSFKQRVCSCKDAPCATAVMADLNLWNHEPAIQTALDDPPTSVIATRTAEVVSAFKECANRAMTAPK